MKQLTITLGLLLTCLAGTQPLQASPSPPPLRWAADFESGAPSVFQLPGDDSKKIVGFETEIAEAIAEKLGKKPIFVNAPWEGLIPSLNRNIYDIAINALEITPERQKVVNFSIPYYITSETLAVNVDNNEIHSLQDCKNGTVGTLRNSLAAQILKEEGINARFYATEHDAFLDLIHKRVDAVLIDAPIALYYGGPHPSIKLLDEVISRIEYGIAMRPQDTMLLKQVNEALKSLIDSGELRNILERWNLWNPFMADYLNDHSPSTQPHTNYDTYLAAHLNIKNGSSAFKKYLSFLPPLGRGALITVEISISAMLLAIFVGFILAIFRIYGPKPLKYLSNLYIEIVRGTPLLIQLYFIFYGLPSIGIKFDPFFAGVFALGMNYAAFEAENYRAGILSVHKGQMEAARALGMTHWQGLRHIVIPQAIHVMLPPVTNDFISLLKDSSLVSVITIIDLTLSYNLLATTYYNYFGIGIVVAIIYLLLGLPFVQLARWAERRLRVERQR